MEDSLWKILLMKYIEMLGRLNIVKIPFHGLQIGAKWSRSREKIETEYTKLVQRSITDKLMSIIVLVMTVSKYQIMKIWEDLPKNREQVPGSLVKSSNALVRVKFYKWRISVQKVITFKCETRNGYLSIWSKNRILSQFQAQWINVL